MKIIVPVIGLCAGILLGIKSGIVLPYAMMAYGGVGILACLDTVLGGVRIPIVMESDKETIQVCIKSCNEIDKSNPRVVRIPNSLHLEHIMLSESYLEEAKNNPQMEIESEPEYLPFDEDGNLW